MLQVFKSSIQDCVTTASVVLMPCRWPISKRYETTALVPLGSD
jgi:hypothetical protein